MTRTLFFSFLLMFTPFLYADETGIVKGHITDDQGEPLSFVSVFIKGTQIGTTCNERGNYEIRIAPGAYELVFQYIGYKSHTTRVDVVSGSPAVVNVQLEPASYNLKEFTVNATAEDPAYPIMRQVIARRRLYRNEAKEYKCRVYMKGLQRLTTIPKRVLLIKVPEDVKPGIVYLSESLSELSFQQPDNIKERMISSKVSGDNQAFSYNQAAALQFTLYDNIVPSYGLNQRGFISPLAWNAMMYYKFRLIGESKENGLTIFKIQLIPIRKNDPVFKGHIYVVKDSWRLHSTDLLLDQDANVEFVDTLYIKQNYARQPGGVWMPVSQRLIFQLGILGFRGNGYFVSVFSNYQVNSVYPPAFYARENTAIVENVPTPQVKKVAAIKPKKIINLVGKADKKDTVSQDSSLFNKKYFNKEILSIDKKANKTDDSTWEAVRPIPLSEEEIADYHEKDSAEAVHTSKAYLDSMDKRGNKLDWSSFILSGYGYARSYERQYFYVDPMLALVQYNTVEGWILNERISFSRTFEDERRYSIAPHLRYGFGSRKFYANVSASYLYDPVKDSRLSLAGGLFVEQYNRHVPITPEINSAYTIFGEQNFLKEYQKGYIRPGFTSELWNGFMFAGSVEYARRISLQNAVRQTFIDNRNRTFTSNIPVNKELGSAFFDPHNALVFDLNFRITFAQWYATRPNEKINYGSKYPRLNISYRKGVPVLSSVVDFDEVSVWVNDRMGFNLFGEFHYYLQAGTFLNASKLYLPDFQHFQGNLTSLSTPQYHGYQLLDYYFYSTSKSYFEAHFDHHFNGFFINKLPLIRKLKWQEVASLNYLKTGSSSNYAEWGVGIEHIFKFFRVDYFRTVKPMPFSSVHGIRIGFGF